ncbi:hypothetical protein BJ138DRAFT_1124096 [Hygrophoropsis aurantiaca]|uniref:Uncharacterized protein n=1 Tax=Hygrophoropsis aurantiaca TaxID=72124 RepID=A0ACB8ALJ2_9AGAM|nr:hypothetical protein BJ138DRAFT_1124096 [Hygrophoropsis aurantiaca]
MNAETNSCFVNSDLTDRILTNLPSFGTLQATILTSKSIHAVFCRRRKSIIRAVAYNQIGPALPQALRLVRCKQAQRRKKQPVTDVEENLRTHPELEDPDISNREIKALPSKASVVQELENTFSYRAKDRRFKTSQLTPVERLRFQKAAYRIWLYSSLYGFEGCVVRRRRTDATFDLFAEDIDAEDIADYTEDCSLKQKKFFYQFPTPEVREIGEVVTFMKDIARQSEEIGLVDDFEASNWYLEDIALFHGPEEVYLTSMGDADWAACDGIYIIFEKHSSNFLANVLSSILTDCGDSITTKVIVDKMVGPDDKCQACARDNVASHDLFNSSNWSSFFDIVNFSELAPLGYLTENMFEMESEPCGFFYLREFAPTMIILEEIFELKTEAYKSWEKDDWMCTDCLTTLVTDHLHVWHLAQKRKHGLEISEDCPDGYRCWEQSDEDHAEEYNHLCGPAGES